MADSDPSSAPNPYLTRPATPSTAPTSLSQPSSSTASSKSNTRLYIGNLHPTVDEYTLIQTFSQFGKISKLDFLFHKAGPQRGQPRGYAFVEYSIPEEALRAVAGAQDKTLRGRKVSVTFATKSDASGETGPVRRDRRAAGNEVGEVRTTQLSISKSKDRPQGVDAKIAAMEARLAKLRQKKEPVEREEEGKRMSGHASLPAKPNFKPEGPTKKPPRRT